MAKKTKADPNPFSNRIVGYGTKAAREFTANPLNYRTHPPGQRAAVQSSLRELGWIGVAVENAITGRLIDGHERVAQALATNQDVPYITVELSEEEERLALAIFDPITGMAQTDAAILDELLAGVRTDDAVLQELMAGLAEDVNLYDAASAARGAHSGPPRGDTLWERVVHRPKWNKKRGGRFLSLCAWNKRTRGRDIVALHLLKESGDYAELVGQIAEEVTTALDQFVGRSAIAWITTPPRSHIADRHFATDGAQAIAALMGVPFVRIFADTPRDNRSHPSMWDEKVAPTLEAIPPPGMALLYDDVATSGTTLEYCSGALKIRNPVLPLAWIYEDTLLGNDGEL